MPCFKGLAVSIHTPDGPLSEMGVQKQSRQSRISSYIPVPPAKIPAGSLKNKPEQSTFAISITLLTPGLTVPYSTPKPTPDDPYPQPRTVGQLPGSGWGSGERGRYFSSVPPYVPRTSNPNETIAAYIYFDGRAKEEVATLLRRGEETWVNSRWVSVPESEGGGLAEREFLFREVGLERWLNGLDLEGSNINKAERIERRQRRLEKKRRKKRDIMGMCDPDERTDGKGVLRYGGDRASPVEELEDDKDGFFSSDSDDDDEPPQPEAAGQIKIALFRVLASGEIKRGEYSPQFGAHDDDDDANGNGQSNGNGDNSDADHMTSFAKPKTLDPSSISTQTVTGLDPPESPYAVFTFFYRGDKQLRKLGILPGTTTEATPVSTKRKSTGPDFSNLGPLKATGTKGFSGYRDSTVSQKKTKDRSADAMDSDNDDDDMQQIPNGNEHADEKQANDSLLSPDDVKQQGEIAEGVEKMKLKRQHSAEPLGDHGSAWKSPHLKHEDSPPGGTPQSINSVSAVAGTPPPNRSPTHDNNGLETIGSPFKRHRASVPSELDNSLFSLNAGQPMPPATAAELKDATTPASTTTSSDAKPAAAAAVNKVDSDEEL